MSTHSRLINQRQGAAATQRARGFSAIGTMFSETPFNIGTDTTILAIRTRYRLQQGEDSAGTLILRQTEPVHSDLTGPDKNPYHTQLSPKP
jgi:hypothetical protein